MCADFVRIREALASLDPSSAHEAIRPPALEEIYTPPGHEAALDPDRPLVVGARGMGKSFWSGVLAAKGTRDFVADVYPRLGLDKCVVRLGFTGTDTTTGGPISTEILDELLRETPVKPELVWRAVILRAAENLAPVALPTSWKALVAWCAEDAERLQLTLRQLDDALAAANQRLVIVFDGLDRLGDSWPTIRERTQALLRVTLALRSYRFIKFKIFMRSDQAADEALFAFPDASKLTGAKVDLTWERRDLYGLAFTRLLNDARAGQDFIALSKLGTAEPIHHAALNELPPAIKDDEKAQERIFSAIAGPYMGSDRRRGKTYTWLHGHLADAFGRVSPRSFLMALRTAARFRPAPVDKSIDAKGLEAGVQQASDVRVDQLGEEYKWIKAALAPLADLRVPCEASAFHERWNGQQTIDKILKTAEFERYLGPIELNSGDAKGTDSLLEALRRIGVVEQRPDGRINMPDIYRVAAKLLRMGGVRPKP